METFQARLTRKLSDALSSAGLPFAGEVTPATDPRFGDYQSNVAMVLAKQCGENPRKIGENVISKLDVAEISEPPSFAGAGFINFTLKRAAVEEKIAELLGDERLGVATDSSPKKIVVDFGSPNVAKPMHVGHIRSAFLGDALARTAEFLGHDVIRDNHIGDWGTQFGMVIWGWKNLLDLESLKRDPIAELVRIYKETNERGTKDETVREAGRARKVAGRRSGKFRDLETMCRSFAAGIFKSIRVTRRPLRHCPRRKFL
jgi:arginyl-tRNA synthetase